MSNVSDKAINIVIADGYTLNPGDLSWEVLQRLGSVTYYDRTSPEQMTDRCKEATIIVTNKAPVPAEVINAARNLRLIAVTATGYNIVNTDAARTKGVAVCNVPVYGTASVAQHTFALILELSNRVGAHSSSVRNGDWSRSADWCYTLAPVIELNGKTLGIVGYGRIGQEVAKIAIAFGMNVVYHNRSPKHGSGRQVEIDELFRISDFISLHCPLTKENTGMINSSLISTMKRTAFLVNTSRGQLINEQELAKCLSEKIIAGAALDVLAAEPPPPGHPLTGVDACVITPHIAWISFEARQRLMKVTGENIVAFLNGNPQNIVNA